LHDFDIVNRYEFSHALFTVQTLPFAHSMCGQLSYRATFNSDSLSSNSNPMAYVESSNKFAIYSEDFNLLGMNQFGIQAYFTDYNSIDSGTETVSEIDIIDPCLNPFSLSVPT